MVELAADGEQPWWQTGDTALAVELLAAERRVRAAQAELLGVVAEVSARGLASSLGYRDTVQLLKSELHLSKREATARVEQALASQSRATVAGQNWQAPLAATGRALADGEITLEHVREIHRVYAHAPADLNPDQWGVTERALLDAAARTGPATVRAVGRRVLAYWDQDGRKPDGDERAEASPAREFRSWYGRDGRFKFSGALDPDTGALLEGMLGALAAPRPADESGQPDPRSTMQRQGDALAEVIELAARADEGTVQCGETAALTVTVPLADLQSGTGYLPFGDGRPTSVTALRRTACNAKLIPAVLGTRGEVLDLGRATRLATSGQRHALTLRDRGCSFPGCDRGPKWCVAHHREHWSDGGPTDLDNLVLLCSAHHRVIHHTDWVVRMRDGLPEFLPPQWIDANRNPIRNRIHDPPGERLAVA